MQTIEELRDKIEAAEGLGQVVRTMKGLAAVNIRQYQRAEESLAGYAETVEQAFQVLLLSAGDRLRFRRDGSDDDGPELAIVYGSDQGMVGQFNSRIFAHYRDETPPGGGRTAERWVVAVGRRLAARMRTEGEEVVEAFDLPRAAEGITDQSQRLLPVAQRLRDRGARRVRLMHHLPGSGASYGPVTREVFPLSLDWLDELRQRPWPGPSLPTFRIEAEAMLAELFSQHLFVSLFRAFAGSMAAENASRLASMQAAERNIEDRLDGLRNQYHRRRQSQITSELLDVMAGFEAV